MGNLTTASEQTNLCEPNSAGVDLSQVLAPLVIGITGHRDIREQDREALKGAIKSILMNLKKKKKYSSTPLVLLSALAEGADRLAAEVALSEKVKDQLLVRQLFVPLPMPQAAYEEDFEGDSLREFRILLDQAQGSLERPFVGKNTEASIKGENPQRDLQYESVGKYIVEKSQILIALWDGEDTGLVGGTAAVVKFQKEGLPLTEPCSFEAMEGFPVYHVLTPRVKNPNPVGTHFQLEVRYPDSFRGKEEAAEKYKERARKYYHQMFSRINEFNRYASHPDSTLCSEVKKSKGYLLKDLNEDQFSEQQRIEINRYALADALALRFQNKKIFTDRLMHGTIFLAFLAFVFFAHLSQNPLFLTVSLALVVFGLVWGAVFRMKDGDTKPEDYRAMAEGLRVRFFWRLVGLQDFVTDHYLGKQRSELDWIRCGFRGWDAHSDFEDHVPPANLLERIKLVHEYWVEDQKDYFHRAKRREERRLESIEFWGGILASFALFVGVAMLVLVFIQALPQILSGHMLGNYEYEWTGWRIILIEGALAGAALLHNYGTRTARREHAKQYARMEGVFSRAAETIGARLKAEDSEIALCCIKKLGKEALTENGDWVLLHRERPLDVPHP